MGNNSSQVTSEELKKHQEFLLQMHQAQVEHQIQMRNQMRERMTALQIAKDREMLYWLGAFYLTSTAAMLVGYRRCHRMSVLSPLLPLTFLMGYQADLAYGSKMNRIQSEAENILQFEEQLVALPFGVPSFHSIEDGRIRKQEEDNLRKSHDIFL